MQLFTDLKAELEAWDPKSVAEAAGIVPSTIYFWLSGKTRKPRLDTVIKVAGVLGYHVELVRKKVELRLVK